MDSISAEIKSLFESDQQDRVAGLHNTNPELLIQSDEARLARAREIHNSGTDSLSAHDLYNLAMLFQHSLRTEDYAIAFELATKARDMGYEDARWLSAAAEDRLLIAQGKKQKWGTQFSNRTGTRAVDDMLTDEESGITDEMRSANDVMTRAEQQDWIQENQR